MAGRVAFFRSAALFLLLPAAACLEAFAVPISVVDLTPADLVVGVAKEGASSNDMVRVTVEISTAPRCGYLAPDTQVLVNATPLSLTQPGGHQPGSLGPPLDLPILRCTNATAAGEVPRALLEGAELQIVLADAGGSISARGGVGVVAERLHVSNLPHRWLAPEDPGRVPALDIGRPFYASVDGPEAEPVRGRDSIATLEGDDAQGRSLAGEGFVYTLPPDVEPGPLTLRTYSRASAEEGLFCTDDGICGGRLIGLRTGVREVEAVACVGEGCEGSSSCRMYANGRSIRETYCDAAFFPYETASCARAQVDASCEVDVDVDGEIACTCAEDGAVFFSFTAYWDACSTSEWYDMVGAACGFGAGNPPI